MAEKPTPSGIGVVYKFFKETYEAEGLRGNVDGEGPLTRFKNHWTELSDQDKQDIRGGIEDGTLTY
jgi:hypothetical protein